MPIYHKLVRDRILDILESKNLTYSAKVLSDANFEQAIKAKFNEEIIEYQQTDSTEDALEELVDLLELVYAAANIHNTTPQQLELLRQDKVQRKGAFENRHYLIEVED